MLTPEQQHLAFQRGMDALEVSLLRTAGVARNAYIRASAKAYAETGHPPAHLTATHESRLTGLLTTHYFRTGDYFGRLALRSIKSGRKAALTPIQALMAEWVRTQALRKARMIASTDRDEVIDAIATGLREGLGAMETATAIRKLTGMTPYRASLIARTETHAAATYGSIQSVRDAEQTLDMRMLKQWLPTSDSRTRPEHLAMKGQPAIPLSEKFTVGGELMDRPGDPSASGHNTINCLHPDSVIELGDIKAMTRHWYEGELITIETASGKRLAITPNHPVLTRKGWVAAASLKEGGCVISGTGFQRVRLGNLDVQNVKATAEQMFDSLHEFRHSMRVSRIRVNFHGEVPHSDIDVVNATGQLRNRFKAAFCKPSDHLKLACADLAQGRLLANGLLYRDCFMIFTRLAAHSLMSGASKSSALLDRSLGHAGKHALAAVSGCNAVVLQTQANVAAIGAVCVSERLDGFASQKSLDHLSRDTNALSSPVHSKSIGVIASDKTCVMQNFVDGLGVQGVTPHKNIQAIARNVFEDEILVIGHKKYRGYVYNAETRTGYYICNGVVQHNCRCSLVFEEAE